MRPRSIIILSVALAMTCSHAARGDGPEGSAAPTAADPAAFEARLRALEDVNKRMADRYDELLKRSEEDRKQADRRFDDLRRRYETVQSQLDSSAEEPFESDRPPLPEPSLPAGLDRREPETPPRRRGNRPPFGGSTAAGERARGALEGDEEGEPLNPHFEDGVVFSTDDDEFSLRLHVLDQTDFKLFTPNNMFPARSGLYIPRVRLYFEGRMGRPFEYEVSLQRSVEGVWDLLDGNLNFRPTDAFQIRFGRMLVPYSYDWYDHLEQFFITPERGLFPLNFGLSRSAGLLAHGRLVDDRIQYAAGVFDGRLAGLADNNTVRDAVGYLNVRPFLHSERFPALAELNLGGSIFSGIQDQPQDPLPLRTSLQSSENDEGARSASATFLTFNEGVTPLGSRSAGALHLSYYYKQLSLEAEAQRGANEYYKLGRPGLTRVPVSGSHITMGYFLTGETVRRRDGVVPLRPFYSAGRRFGPGAIELFARYSELRLGASVFEAGLSDPRESTRALSMVDLGFNWYPNRFVKFYVDYQLPFFSTPVLVNPGRDVYSNSAAMFWIRCQIYF